MIETANATQALTNVKTSIQEAVMGTVESMFGLSTIAQRQFQITYPLRNDYGISCNLHMSNNQYHGTISIGINESDLGGLVSSDDKVFQMDALGELSNTIVGAIMESEAFISEFGFLEQAPPLLIEGGFTMRKTWGIEGVFWAGDSKIYAGFAVWEKKKRAC